MPRATISVEDTERVNLKSCPEGFVELRKLTYREFLYRRELVGKMTVRGTRDKSKKNRDFEGEFAMANKVVTLYEFKHCIVDHNLEDEAGKKLDFGNEMSLTFLDPKIGEEIGTHIDRMNQFDEAEDDDDEVPFGPESSRQ